MAGFVGNIGKLVPNNWVICVGNMINALAH